MKFLACVHKGNILFHVKETEILCLESQPHSLGKLLHKIMKKKTHL